MKRLGDQQDSHHNISGWLKKEMMCVQELLAAKSKVCKTFKEKLVRSGTVKIYHSVKSRKWGIGCETVEIVHPLKDADIVGDNLHGLLLMDLRNEIVNEKRTGRHVHKCIS